MFWGICPQIGIICFESYDRLNSMMMKYSCKYTSIDRDPGNMV